MLECYQILGKFSLVIGGTKSLVLNKLICQRQLTIIFHCFTVWTMIYSIFIDGLLEPIIYNYLNVKLLLLPQLIYILYPMESSNTVTFYVNMDLSCSE